MRKLFIISAVATFLLGMASCGHGTCDAYNKSDYTQYKKDQTEKIEMVQELTETQK